MTDTQIDLLKTALDWTKAEMFSSASFAVFGICFLLASFGFFHFGKTEMAKAYILPLLVAGGLLFIIGAGLVISNQLRLAGFPVAYEADAAQFLTSEMARADKTINSYTNVAFRVIPLIITLCAVLIIFLHAPIWRASLITTIAILAVIMVVDTNANARLVAYKAKLLQVERQS